MNGQVGGVCVVQAGKPDLAIRKITCSYGYIVALEYHSIWQYHLRQRRED